MLRRCSDYVEEKIQILQLVAVEEDVDATVPPAEVSHSLRKLSGLGCRDLGLHPKPLNP